MRGVAFTLGVSMRARRELILRTSHDPSSHPAGGWLLVLAERSSTGVEELEPGVSG